MPRKIIYLINPISGTRGKSSLKELINRKTREQQIPFTIENTNSAGDYAYLSDLIGREGITDIVICGGDGTVSAVSAALMDVPVNTGIIPMGSGNGLALAAGIPTNPEKAIDLLFTGEASYIDGFTINGQFSCMLCGIGFDAQVAHEFALQKERGLRTYIRVSLANFFRARPYSFGIQTPERSLDTEAYFISIANGNQFGNNVTIAPRARLDDGLLDIVVVQKMSKFRLPFSVLGQANGNRAKNILYFQTPSLTLYNSEEAPLHIDGDPKATAREFQICIVPRALRLIQPKKAGSRQLMA